MEHKDSFDQSSAELRANVGHQDGQTVDNVDQYHTDAEKPLTSQAVDATGEQFPLVEEVLRSDIGVNTLLTRLKQSIASARVSAKDGKVITLIKIKEFAAFLKKRSTLEEEHAQGLKKLCRSSHDSARRPDNRQGDYVHHYNEVISIHDRIADNGTKFALSLHQMHEDLHDLASNTERGRKQWKQTGLTAEKRVQDSEALMEKAKAKYDALAEDYDRARTGDKQTGRVFGLKGPKSAAQHEEDLHRKVQAAELDYSNKVQTTQNQRQELVSVLRPQAVRAIHDLITECDAGLSLQLQKFASFNEKLLLSDGLCVSPLKSPNHQDAGRSLRDVVYEIDNGRDLNNYILSFSSKVDLKPTDIRYERHPTLTPSQPQFSGNVQSQDVLTHQQQLLPSSVGHLAQPPSATGHNIPQNQGPNPTFVPDAEETKYPSSPQKYAFSPGNVGGPPQIPHMQVSTPIHSPTTTPIGGSSNETPHSDLPPSKPVFGMSLDDLLRRDGSAVPLVVYQCFQAVELFGLDVEGIYRLSGSAVHVAKLRALFDHDSSLVDFRNPENFFHDVNSVAGLLKQFFRDLPDPLLTHEHFQGFIDAARIEDDVTRRDSLHALINSLPDPNYATLRALILHLHRVQEHSGSNRMNAGNLAICFGPTLMGTGPNISDAGWQVRVIETILQNTYQIFDDD
ncbi:MAG: hypothetical protein LQ342_001053 [Letrouitia transgressa]|nr:MAG: hypothetical protein LQ342_001053 [Letrouitia transgressa]